MSSLRCSLPMHSSKPFCIELYTEGLECLWRRQINKRISQGLLVQNLISIHIESVKHTVEPLPTATSLQQPLFFSSWGTKKAIRWFLFKGRYTLDDKLQQHSEATGRSDKLLRVYWRIFVKIFVAATEFVAATSRTDSVWFDFLRLVAATKFRCTDKDFPKNSPVHTERFVAATCRLTVLLQLVARPVHMEWSVAATCCCNLSHSVYRP